MSAALGPNRRIAIVAASLTLACGTATEQSPSFAMNAIIDGHAWNPSVTPGGRGPSAAFAQHDQVLTLGGNGGSDFIVVAIRDVTGPGSYSLGDTATIGCCFVGGEYVRTVGNIFDSTFSITEYTTSTSAGGVVVLSTFDPSTHQVQGTFAFEAVSPQGAHAYITSGSFAGQYTSSP